jgi:hypothetical protein
MVRSKLLATYYTPNAAKLGLATHNMPDVQRIKQLVHLSLKMLELFVTHLSIAAIHNGINPQFEKTVNKLREGR